MNEKLKQAYDRLGLPENVSREEINKRFDLLLKRRRSKSKDEERSAPEEDFQAFKFILDTLDKQEIQEAEEQRLAKYGKLSGAASKWEDFMRLYKTHVIISVIAIIVLAVAGNAIYKNVQHKKYLASLPPLDATIMFLGNFGVQDPDGQTAALDQAIVEQYPEWKRVETNMVYLPRTGPGVDSFDMNYMQKAVVELAANHPDIIILDEATLQWIGGQDGFQNLESLVTDGTLSKNDTRLKWGTNEESGEEELYGVDIIDSEFVKALPINHATEEMIIGVLGEDAVDKAAGLIKHITAKSSGE
ncbi:molecular chaperone DnaJ [Paenibacillus sp. PK3_47]|uniref:molecular chaperone DnaJ n=1 Tax=Paenibacillus sp. PK3_47 TaxID=2072642 RepID=UPI00201D7A5F|nr:molecular chaperone DnaJ [Paenibacillus sp. PK3_47]